MLHVIASNITVLVFARVVVEAVSSGWSSFTAHVVVVVVVVEVVSISVVTASRLLGLSLIRVTVFIGVVLRLLSIFEILTLGCLELPVGVGTTSHYALLSKVFLLTSIVHLTWLIVATVVSASFVCATHFATRLIALVDVAVLFGFSVATVAVFALLLFTRIFRADHRLAVWSGHIGCFVALFTFVFV